MAMVWHVNLGRDDGGSSPAVGDALREIYSSGCAHKCFQPEQPAAEATVRD
ncbi:MAG: hypothetical protein R2932_10685 [Caldilineaceae bacterium]